MAYYLNIIGGQFPALTSAEVVTWKASGLLNADAVIDYEAGLLIWYDFDTDSFLQMPFGGGGGTYAAQHPNHSGTLADTNLIGLTNVIGVSIDGSNSLFVVDGVPVPGTVVNINTTTGEVDPGFAWDSNTVIIQYTSNFVPIGV